LKIKEEIIEFYQTQQWDRYRVSVHGVKSSMLSIGAMKLSEMAKKLEFAVKEDNISYIIANHEDMIKEYERIYEILAQNEQLCPNQKVISLKNDLPELTDDVWQENISIFENAVYDFDSDTMQVILSELENYQYHGSPLAESLVEVKRKVDMMDYMSALDIIQTI